MIPRPNRIRFITTLDIVSTTTARDVVVAFAAHNGVVIDRSFQCVVTVSAIQHGKGAGIGAEIEDVCLNLTHLNFQLRITAEDLPASQIVRGGHIGASELCQGVDKLLTRHALSDIAAVQEDVAIYRERLANGLQLALVIEQVVRIQLRSAEIQRTDAAMGEDLYRIQIAVSGQQGPHLLDTVLPGIQ